MRTILFQSHPLDALYKTLFRSKLCGMVAASLLSLALFGCAAAYNARTDLAPDERHAVCCHIRGAAGRSYSRQTTKRIGVTIYSRGPNDSRLLQEDMDRQMSTGAVVTHPIPGLEIKPIFQKQYHVKGSDVSWYSVWQPDNSISIVFYDQGRDEAAANSSKQSASERVLLTLHFDLDPMTGNYVEANELVRDNHSTPGAKEN